jgi:copper(I)-binding protein
MQPTGYTLAALMFASVLISQGHAQTADHHAIAVERPWARATPGGAKTGAVYVSLTNKGSVADRLLSATTPVAEKVQFHSVSEEGGVVRMREMPAIEIAPGANVVFSPGGMHIMLVGLNQPMREGHAIPLTLVFEKGGKVDVMVPVAKVGAMQHGDMDPAMHGAERRK